MLPEPLSNQDPQLEAINSKLAVLATEKPSADVYATFALAAPKTHPILKRKGRARQTA
jgi:hypothetical protein